MSSITLSELIKLHPDRYTTDKNDYTTHTYCTDFYDKEFAKYKESLTGPHGVYVLEIGINSGGSILLWNDYFCYTYKIHSRITGIDINIPQDIANKLLRYSSIEVYQQDAYKQLLKNKAFDIIIDDGSHEVNDQIIVVREYSKLLLPGGILVIEDVQSIECMQLLMREGYSLANQNSHFVFETYDLRYRVVEGRHDNMLFVVRRLCPGHIVN